MMKEQLKYGENFLIIFDEMSISVIGPESILKVNIFIDIEIKDNDKDVLDDKMFKPEKVYKLMVKTDIKEQLGSNQTQLNETHKILGEAKKLIDFIKLNEENFLEKIVPELRLKVNENFSH